MSSYNNLWRVGYLSWRRPRNWFHNIRQFFRNLKYIYQRSVKGYSYWDLWDLDMFYSHLFVESLQEFRNKTNGIPMDVYEAHKNDTDEGAKAWEEELNNIITHFKNSLKRNEKIDNEYHELLQLRPESDEQYMELKHEFFEKEKAILNFADNEFKLGWDMLGNRFHDLWF